MGALDAIIVRGKRKKRVVRAGTIIKIVIFMNDYLLIILMINLLTNPR